MPMPQAPHQPAISLPGPLSRASLLASLTSFFQPRRLSVALQFTPLENDQVALTPLFSVDGHSVAADLFGRRVGKSAAHSPLARVLPRPLHKPLLAILGHWVRIDHEALGVLRSTAGEPVVWPLSRAGRELEAVAGLGVPIHTRDGGRPVRVCRARPRVCLALAADDALAVTATLLTTDGQSVAIPSDLPRLRANDNWHVAGDDVVRIDATSRSLDSFLLADNGTTTLRGNEIPRFLDLLSSQSSAANPGTTGQWSVVVAPSVAETHRLIDVPAATEFRVGVVERDGAALLRIDPIHRHERFQVGHDEALRCAGEQEKEWIRRRGAWIRIDRHRIEDVSRTGLALGLVLAGDGYEFPAADRERIIEAFATLGGIRHAGAYASFLAGLADFEQIEEVPLPANLRAGVKLRPYQRHGVNWLVFLQKFSLSGILADDMGLGKTLQTLTAIERVRETTGSRLPVLIICPTSVMLNWQNEIGKFLEQSQTILFHGPSREKHVERMAAAGQATADRAAADNATLDRGGLFVITSFDCARIDHDTLNRIGWLYVVVDEGHTIKNPDAQRSKAIKTIPARTKLALTGTPIQNKLEELWSLFDFAMPGFLESRATFRRRFTINNRVDWPAVNDHLIPRIRPFVLRRLKSAVARDLPEKIIVERQVPLTPLQVTLYNSVRDSAEFHRMREEVDRNGVARSQTHIFAALTKLQNICNHPAIATGLSRFSSALPADSGKLDLLQELIEEVVDGGHRALLFSQSTRVLDLVSHWFGQWGVTSLRIDGSTPALDRAGLAERFNSDESINCFLLSTRAAGTGLNLVGADTVIFYDHDWNPANDAQAMDRAYRIGQTRNVTVYKLVSRGTLEEKILARQTEKLSLAEGVIGAEPGDFKDLSRDELFDLFTLDGEP